VALWLSQNNTYTHFSPPPVFVTSGRSMGHVSMVANVDISMVREGELIIVFIFSYCIGGISHYVSQMSSECVVSILDGWKSPWMGLIFMASTRAQHWYCFQLKIKYHLRTLLAYCLYFKVTLAFVFKLKKYLYQVFQL